MKRGPKPTYARIRIEKLEYHIARNIALNREDGVTALRYLARDAGINPNESEIAKHVEMYRKELAR